MGIRGVEKFAIGRFMGSGFSLFNALREFSDRLILYDALTNLKPEVRTGTIFTFHLQGGVHFSQQTLNDCNAKSGSFGCAETFFFDTLKGTEEFCQIFRLNARTRILYMHRQIQFTVIQSHITDIQVDIAFIRILYRIGQQIQNTLLDADIITIEDIGCFFVN